MDRVRPLFGLRPIGRKPRDRAIIAADRESLSGLHPLQKSRILCGSRPNGRAGEAGRRRESLGERPEIGDEFLFHALDTSWNNTTESIEKIQIDRRA